MIMEQRAVWSFNCGMQQSPSVMTSALGLHGMDGYSQMHVPQLYVDSSDGEANDLALTYSDSDLSREPSPLLFDFPSLNSTHSLSTTGLHHPSSDPTPTRLLPPVSFASGEFPPYDDLSNYMMSSYSDNSPAGPDGYFSMLSVGECLPPSGYDGESGRNPDISQSFPPSPWYVHLQVYCPLASLTAHSYRLFSSS